MFNWWTWDFTLGLILGAFCGVCGGLFASLIGYHILLVFGVSNRQRKAARWAVIGFGIPVAIATFIYGYHLGATFVY
jgi:H+/Cl- antiporter ClcA